MIKNGDNSVTEYLWKLHNLAFSEWCSVEDRIIYMAVVLHKGKGEKEYKIILLNLVGKLYAKMLVEWDEAS